VAEESIQERNLQHLKDSLWAIDGTGAYFHKLESVERGKPDVPEDLTQLPAAFLAAGDETVVQETNLLLTRRLPVTVEAWVRSAAGDLPTLANRMIADIERALLADPTRGGLAIRTELLGSGKTPDESPGVLASARVEIAVHYWTLVGNPASVG